MVARSSPPRKATPGPRAPGIRGTLRRARRCRVGAALRLPPGPAGRNREERPSPGRSPQGPPQPWSPKPPPLGKDERQTGGAQGPGRRAGVWHWVFLSWIVLAASSRDCLYLELSSVRICVTCLSSTSSCCFRCDISKPVAFCCWTFSSTLLRGQCPFVLCLHPQGCLRRGVRASGPSQGRTGESGAFGMWPHPRGSSRISS